MRDIKTISLNNIKSSFPCHFHKFYVIGLIKKGCRTMVCNGENYFLSPGDLIIFNPYDIHSCKNFDTVSMSYLALNMEPNLIKNYFDGNSPNFQNVTKGLSPDIFKTFDSTFVRFLKNIPHSFEHQNDCTPEIQKICKIIEQNLSNKISLEFLCDCSSLSKSTLLRAFTKQKGLTPHKYIENIRINKAKSLLDKGLTPLDAAFETGFSSQSHFSNSFKTLMGLTPSEYQKGLKYDG